LKKKEGDRKKRTISRTTNNKKKKKKKNFGSGPLSDSVGGGCFLVFRCVHWKRGKTARVG